MQWQICLLFEKYHKTMFKHCQQSCHAISLRITFALKEPIHEEDPYYCIGTDLGSHHYFDQLYRQSHNL